MQTLKKILFILSKQFKTQKLKRMFYSDRWLAQLNETRGRGLHINRLIYIYISYLFIYMRVYDTCVNIHIYASIRHMCEYIFTYMYKYIHIDRLIYICISYLFICVSLLIYLYVVYLFVHIDRLIYIYIWYLFICASI